jgi:hypothetical protein
MARLQLVSAGSVCAALVWIIGSYLFSWYLSDFANYRALVRQRMPFPNGVCHYRTALSQRPLLSDRRITCSLMLDRGIKDSRKNNRIGFPRRCDVVTRMRVILSHRTDWYQGQHDRPG